MFDNFFKSKRILITGHTGFKGSWLCEWLLSMEADLCGCALEPNTKPAIFDILKLKNRMQHHVLNICDLDAVNKLVENFQPEIIIHMAAQPLVRLSYEDPINTLNSNIMGTANILEAIRTNSGVKACVVVTSDKCYENQEWVWGYRENEPMGGHDTYSASKGAAELVTASYRNSFFHKENACKIATARAGNVIGGGDWSADRIVVDFVRSMERGETLYLRNPNAVRPWQHVLEPLSGYLTIAKELFNANDQSYSSAWNFGPSEESVTTVQELANLLVASWGSGEVKVDSSSEQPHEAGLLKLDCSKSKFYLKWSGKWSVKKAVQKTVEWHQDFEKDQNKMQEITLSQIQEYTKK